MKNCTLWFFLSIATALLAKDKPNIIFILLDDMGYSDLGSFGGEVNTPHMDSLAKEGLRFTQNYNSARCCPSRASFLTGLYSHQAGIANFTGTDNTAKRGPAYRGSLSDQTVTLAEVLKPAGYMTYCVGKWHVGKELLPTNRGFDEFYGYVSFYEADQWMPSKYQRLPEGRKLEKSYHNNDFYATDVFNDYAIEFIRQGRDSKKPFFLYLAHSSPHFPLQAPAKTRDKYLEIYRKGWDVLRKARFEKQKEIGLATKSWSFTELSQVPEDLDLVNDGFGGQQNPEWDTLDEDRKEDLVYRMATFAAMIEHVDDGVGLIVEELKKNGELDNTLIFITSDNGACYEWGPYGFDGPSRKGASRLHQGDDLDIIGGPGTYHSVGSAWSCLSNTPLRMYKHFNHEGGNCSPLVVHWPKGTKDNDRWIRNPVHLIDFMPTICEVAGAEYPRNYKGNQIIPMEGTSLLPLFNGENKIKERTLYFDHFESSAIRSGDWKLVRGNNRYKNRAWEFYNIAEDRCETNNLIDEMPEKVEALKKQWLEWAVRVKINPYYKH